CVGSHFEIQIITAISYSHGRRFGYGPGGVCRRTSGSRPRLSVPVIQKSRSCMRLSLCSLQSLETDNDTLTLDTLGYVRRRLLFDLYCRGGLQLRGRSGAQFRGTADVANSSHITVLSSYCLLSCFEIRKLSSAATVSQKSSHHAASLLDSSQQKPF